MPSRTDIEPKEDNGSISMLTKLGQSQFDPVDFLNDTLPGLSLSSQTQTPKTSRSTQIQVAATESLALLSSLNLINVRASSELTSLTDEIIRSGNRLAYQVEVLRGDLSGFHELLTESLRDDIGHFVKAEATTETALHPDADGTDLAQTSFSNEPDFMTQLRLLGKVKSRLESVITIFGEAMKWPIPSSEISGAALISVSAPEFGIQSTEEDEKAHEALIQLRTEIVKLMEPQTTGSRGLEAAAERVEDYRQLAMLWKGTGEEKARLKFVDSLIKLVEDRRRILDVREAARNARPDGPAHPGAAMGRDQKSVNEGGAAAGLFRNLQRLKDDLYLE